MNAAGREGETSRGLFGQVVQPWDLPHPNVAEEAQRGREELLAALAASKLGTIEAKVGLILQTYPETRDSDITLALRYWREYESDTIANWRPLALEVLHDLQPMTTLIRCRQRIQNDFGLWQGTRRTRFLRDEQQRMLYQYYAEKRLEDPEITFYLDETGSEPSGRFLGVGGVCVLDSRAYELQHFAFRNWRREQGAETFHFADMSHAKEQQFLAFLKVLRKYRSGLMFVGYGLLARGNKQSDLANLFVQLVADAIEEADKQGCLGDRKAVRVVKEAASGFDAMHLTTMEHSLSDLLAQRFPDRIYLRSIEPKPKGREVLLESADMIAAAMKRRWESGHSIHKDRVAAAVMNVTGFEDRSDRTPLYRVFQPPI